MAKSGAKGNRKTGGVKIKKFPMFVSMLSIVMVISLTNVAYRDFSRKPTGESVTNRGSFASPSTEPEPGKDSGHGEGMGNGDPENNDITNFSESDQPVESLPVSERIALISDDNPGTATNKQKSTVVEKEKNDFYKVVEGGVRLNSDALEAFNSMMKAYNEETAYDDFVIYGTTSTYTDSGSCCPESFAESITGDCVDVAVMSWGTPIAFDGYGTEAWIIENCWKYGYILRYPENGTTSHEFCPWHFRYVGGLHAAIMHANGDMCLEEYIDFLSAYTIDQPLTFSAGSNNYEVYTVKAKGEDQTVRVPIKGKYAVYETTGDSYVVAVEK